MSPLLIADKKLFLNHWETMSALLRAPPFPAKCPLSVRSPPKRCRKVSSTLWRYNPLNDTKNWKPIVDGAGHVCRTQNGLFYPEWREERRSCLSGRAAAAAARELVGLSAACRPFLVIWFFFPNQFVTATNWEISINSCNVPSLSGRYRPGRPSWPAISNCFLFKLCEIAN